MLLVVDDRLAAAPFVSDFSELVREWVVLEALYVGGLLATGDYRAGVSDVDVVALVRGPFDAEARRRLRRHHLDFEQHSPRVAARHRRLARDPAFGMPGLVRRVVAFSDVHANVEALDAVLADIEARGISDLWCLGDVVGNGHDPIGCLDRVQARCAVVLAGNHEIAITSPRDDLAPATQFSRAALVRAGRLEEIAAWRSEWAADRIRLAHGCPSPFDAARDYLIDDVAPQDVLAVCADADLIVVGHTHVPGVWRTGDRWLINAGSVGEPRGSDPRPTWVEIQWTQCGVRDAVHHRVAFDQERYLANMTQAGLEIGPMWASSST